MNPAIPLLLVLATAGTVEQKPAVILASTEETRFGYDTNPRGAAGPQDASSAVMNLGLGLNLNWSKPAEGAGPLKLGYALQAQRFFALRDEDYATHRLSFSGTATAGRWKFATEGSTTFVAGTRETLASVPTMNANGIAIWRERRRQWQHRFKATGQASFGPWFVRGSSTLLAIDYRTAATVGRVAFADRQDAQAGMDIGRAFADGRRWFLTTRFGRQFQGRVPLPNSDFDYSNNYQRAGFGWEGAWGHGLTMALAGGPQRQRFTGSIDPRVWTRRNRASAWFEGNISAQPLSRLTLTGTGARMDWLSSTGKSAYTDTSFEAAANWRIQDGWTARATGRWHRCDYYPAIREDIESFVGVGALWTGSKNVRYTLDLLRHHGWSALTVADPRTFGRWTMQVGVELRQ